MWFVVGLGNPGKRYTETRHNAGFLVVERLAARMGVRCDKSQLGALVGAGVFEGQKVMLAMPQTFMNRSGEPVRSLLGYYKVPVDHLLVVHDEVDLPFGQLRLKKGGGHGGHNGLRDLHRHLDTPAYARLRFGVNRPPEGLDTAAHVLGRWSLPQRDGLDDIVDTAADAALHAVTHGVGSAMNKFHKRIKAAPPPASTDEQPNNSTAQIAGGAT